MKRSFTARDLVLGLLSVTVLWEIAARLLGLTFFPPASEVLPLLFGPLGPEILKHTAATAARVLAAILLAVATGVPSGLVLALSPRADRLATPLLAALYPIPKIVFLPVAYVLWGVNDAAKIVIVALILYFQVTVLVRDALAALDRKTLLSVRSLGAGRLALLRFVYVPASIPSVLTAVRISIGTALAVLFIAEQSLNRWGLGYFIVVRSYQALDYPKMFTGILAISVLGLGLYYGVAGLERLSRRRQ